MKKILSLGAGNKNSLNSNCGRFLFFGYSLNIDTDGYGIPIESMMAAGEVLPGQGETGLHLQKTRHDKTIMYRESFQDSSM